MRTVLLMAAVMLGACGGPDSGQSSSGLAATAEAGVAACDYCPGNTSASVSDGMEFCPCPSGGRNAFIFNVSPPLASCARIQCEYAFWVAHECLSAIPGADGGLVVAQCGP